MLLYRHKEANIGRVARTVCYRATARQEGRDQVERTEYLLPVRAAKAQKRPG